ncbi:ABC transporter permease [Actinomadura sp. ATCC 31491]|uniref:Transport permease protein n=1 Tax=Actinomadura luzonensis TaxID=2805427 RepID=A0ABT0GA52_9ACTN|nr:ABC transporter permease [Actinomadura luzonensis]MCK2221100.1 ABC transporter permease [Actinomadura luzonensis]
MRIIRETLMLYRVHLAYTFKTKIGIIMGMIQPILYLVLFGPLLIKITPGTGGGSNSWTVFVPGVLVYLALFGPGFAGFSIISDLRAGVIERMRVTPVSRLAMLMGRVLNNLTIMIVQAVLVTAAGFALGMRAQLLGIFLGLVILSFLAAGLAALSLALGVGLKSEDQFAPVVTFAALPIMLLSGILLPMSLAPPWLDVLSRLNPLRYIVDGVRDLFSGHYSGSTVLWGFVAAVGMCVACVAAGTRMFNKENA